MSNASEKFKFSTAQIVIAAVILIAAVFLSYTFYTRYQDKKAIESTATSTIPTPPVITTSNDLDEAAATMDTTEAEVELDTTDDLSELDKELAEF
jgi:Flp pilus assembly protein CpaB